VQRAIAVPNVGDPTKLVDLACDAEAAGWDGFFLWDHVQIYAPAAFEVHDPWMVLAAAAHATERVRLGAMVSPPSRRRPWNLAKQIVTLDHLSGGRAVVGIGLGFPAEDEFGAFGDATDLHERAARTDEAMEIIDRVLRGEPVDHIGEHYEVHAHLHPATVQSPRPRIWAAATPPHRRPLERAARWDGVYCNLKVEDDLMPLRPEELRDYVGAFLDDPGLDVVTSPHPDHPAVEYEALGVTWLVDSSWPGPDWLEQFRERLGLS
jgi:alkanesulfonate monooxygenase SsuD/methylene tetrahydromethanopterin reductase-like flavin-dependent oxidoreductase (luciferase family)